MRAELWTDCLFWRAPIKIFSDSDKPSNIQLIASDKDSSIIIHCCVSDLLDLKDEITKFLEKQKTVKNQMENQK